MDSVLFLVFKWKTVAMRTRNNLKRSERARILLKIGTLLSKIKCFFVTKWIELNLILKVSDEEYHWYFFCSVVIPLFDLAGAIKVKRISIERESFIKVSSDPQVLYL